MKKLFLTAIFSVMLLAASAQNYSTAIGLRAGPHYGLTIKHFVSPNGAIEGIFSPAWGGFTLFGLYEYHTTAFKVSNMNWYFGFGGHAGVWWWGYYPPNKHYPNWWWWDGDPDRGDLVIGVDMILGLEYTAEQLPMNISLDWKPALNLIGHQGFMLAAGGVSLRYAF